METEGLLEKLQGKVQTWRLRRLLGGLCDDGGAILTIQVSPGMQQRSGFGLLVRGLASLRKTYDFSVLSLLP